MEAVVAPLLQANEYPAVPPEAEALAPPSLPPLQLTFESKTAAATNTVGCVIVIVSVSVQLFASITVTVYVPAVRFAAVAVFAPELQAKE